MKNILITMLAVTLTGCRTTPEIIPDPKMAEAGGIAPTRLKASQKVTYFNSASDGIGDYGGTPSQSFVCKRSELLTGIELAINTREGDRELVITLQRADENGFPRGRILSSGAEFIGKDLDENFKWVRIQLAEGVEIKGGAHYAFTLIPSEFRQKFGFFNYSFTKENKYPGGRLHQRGRGRRVSEDDGKDFSFGLVFEQ